MESTISVSKGVFVFANGLNKHKNAKKSPKSIFEKMFSSELWHETYKNNWETIENQIKELHQKTYRLLLNDIVNYVSSCHSNHGLDFTEGIIPSATLLTGVNQPDHVSQFNALIEKIREEVTPHISTIHSQDAPTLKHCVENVVWQLLHGEDALFQDISDDEYNDSMTTSKKLKKSQCTMRELKKWYSNRYINRSPKKKGSSSNKPLVVIIQDFESFSCNVLQDFVMIVSSYVTLLPIILVFGVATSVSAIHKSFPYHVSSKLLIRVFHSHSATNYMNKVAEEIFLTHNNPFMLSGRVLNFLTDVFLFYDFSVSGLIQSTKYCMLEHYYGDNAKSLCCERSKLKEAIVELSGEDLENIRKLLSFRPFLESQNAKMKIDIFTKDSVFKKVLYEELNKFHDYLFCFYLCVKLLAIFVKDLPSNGMGKTVREIYSKCTTDNITETQTFKDSMQLLQFQSQVNLVENIQNALQVVNSALQLSSPVAPLNASPAKNNSESINLNGDVGQDFVKSIRVHLMLFTRQIETANTEITVRTRTCSNIESSSENMTGDRLKFREKLQQAIKTDKIQSEFEMIRSRFISYLEEMFTQGLQPPWTRPFHEIFFFSDLASVKKQIVGAPRGALHTALSNPAHYLQCMCCHISTADSMVPTMPDLCISYKLLRECGKLVNLYDWLQAFAAILRPEDDDEGLQDPVVQARFTRTVAELEFLGFIKSSKRKTDHVMRLTW